LWASSEAEKTALIQGMTDEEVSRIPFEYRAECTHSPQSEAEENRGLSDSPLIFAGPGLL
jgi:hypothetical protein